MKTCNKCKNKKDFSEFYKYNDNRTSDGFRGTCKLCERKRQNKYVTLHPQKQSLEYKRNWQKSDVAKKYRKTEEYRKKHLESQLKYYKTKKFKDNIQFKLKSRIRKRVWESLNGKKKPSSAVKELGCTVEELKNYLENQFEGGMSWSNWGFFGWHIDHIKPLSSFDLTDIVQFKEACHYTNLRPMWGIENIKKGKKIDIK